MNRTIVVYCPVCKTLCGNEKVIDEGSDFITFRGVCRKSECCAGEFELTMFSTDFSTEVEEVDIDDIEGIKDRSHAAFGDYLIIYRE